MVRLSLPVLLVAATPALAFWRMECRGVVGDYRIDPLMSPGEAAQHVHAILGSGGFTASATNDDIMASDCTSCLVTQDKSSYWHPALYFHDTDADTYELVTQQGGTLAYYLLNGLYGESNITAFPSGFRMIAGKNSRRTYTVGNYKMVDPPKSEWALLGQTTQDALGQRALGFNCLDYSATAEGSLQRHFLPDKAFLDSNCPDGIRFELMFPQCWNGKDVDSDNHMDHVAYPDLVMEGTCPDDFPVRLPGLFYETIWDTAAFASQNGEFVISNGDRQGFSYHGDFMMGWDEGVLQEAVDTCTSLSGEISDCPVFNIQSLADATSCKIKPPTIVAADDVAGPAATLPGDLSLFGDLVDGSMVLVYDAAQATTIAVVNTGTAAAANTTSTLAAAATATAGLAGHVVANANSAVVSYALSSPATPTSSTLATVSTSAPTTPTTSTTPTPTPTPTSTFTSTSPPPTTTAAVYSKIVSTQYITVGNQVTEILWEETTLYVTEGLETVTTTMTATAATTPEAKMRRRHGHMRRHGARKGF